MRNLNRKPIKNTTTYQYRFTKNTNEKYDASTENSSSSQTRSFTKGKNISERSNMKLTPNNLVNNIPIPSFITQVSREQQKSDSRKQYYQEENDQSEDAKPSFVRTSTMLETLCDCLKFRRSRGDEIDEESSLGESELSPNPSIQQPQMANNVMLQNKPRGPLQTSTPKQILQQHPQHYGKKSLAIDLDETLVHSSFTPIQNADFILKIKVQNMPFTVYIKKRPGCEFFLEELSKYYELIIFTASLSEYADPVMDKIDRNKVCSLRLFRENCTLYNGVFVKDLSLMNRELSDLIIIDNSESSFLFQPANAVHIKSYFDDPKDRELYRLIPMLIFLSNCLDVRNVEEWWRQFEQNDYVDYRDRKNRLQRLDKQKMLEELGDLRKRDLKQEQEFMNSNSMLIKEEMQNQQIQMLNQPINKKNGGRNLRKEQKKEKPPLMIEVPELEEVDNLVADRDQEIDNINNDFDEQQSSARELESVRNQLLMSKKTDLPSTQIRTPRNGTFRSNECEDYNGKAKGKQEEDSYSFKTQPDVLLEDSESYKEMKLIFDNIRYSNNNQNINSPVSKQRFAQLLHSNSQRKKTDKLSPLNDETELHFFTSPKKQIKEFVEVSQLQEKQEQVSLQFQQSSQDLEQVILQIQQSISKSEDVVQKQDQQLMNKDEDDVPIFVEIENINLEEENSIQSVVN